MRPAFLLALFAFALTTGCDGIFTNVYIASLAHGQSSPSPCTLPAGSKVALVYPANGSTGIPDNLGQIIFAAAPALSANYRAYLVDETGNQQLDFDPLAGWNQAIPQPAAAPSFADPTYQGSENPGETFPKGHLISAALQLDGCNATSAYGSFTVQ